MRNSDDPEAPARRSVFERPYVCLAIGLAAFPVAKLLYICHEFGSIGHPKGAIEVR